MTSLDATTQESLQQALYAYLQAFGADAWTEQRAIAGALLSVKTKAGELSPQGLEVEEWVDALINDFDPDAIAHQVREAAAQRLAQQAKTWRETLAVKAQATVDAYIQQYAPDLDAQTIRTLITTVLPIVEDATITRDEAFRLIDLISSQVDGQSAGERVIDPKWYLLAEKVQQVMQHQDVETATTEVVNAYVHKFQPAAIAIGVDLIEQAVQAVTNSRVKLGLDVELDAATRQLLIRQVMLKVNLMEPSAPSKTAIEIAQQIHDEVERYRREHGLDNAAYLPPVTTTDRPNGDSSLGGEISIGIELKPGTVEAEPGTADSNSTA